MRNLKSGCFHQTSPPGPIRDILEPFLANFHGVIQVLKRLHGVRWYTGSCIKNDEVKEILQTKTKSIGKVNKRFTMFFYILLL